MRRWDAILLAKFPELRKENAGTEKITEKQNKEYEEACKRKDSLEAEFPELRSRDK